MKCIVCFSFTLHFASGYNFPFSLHMRGPDFLLILFHPVHFLWLFCRLKFLSITSRLTVDLFLALTTASGHPRLLLVRILFDDVRFKAGLEGTERSLWRRVKGREFQICAAKKQKVWPPCCFLLKMGIRKVVSPDEHSYNVYILVCVRMPVFACLRLE